MPKVTVLMSVYNRETFVGQAIDSILSQTFHDFEFLIINDGSTDKTRKVISSYEDSRIRLIDNPTNLGIPRSLNKGLQLAHGQYIARLDSDDISEPCRLAKQVEFLENNSTVVLVGSGYQEIDEQGNLLGKYNLPSDCLEIRWGLSFYTPFLNSSVMFRKNEVLEKVGLYNEEFTYSQDHELWARIANLYPVENLVEPLVKYCVHPSSITIFHETQQYDFLFQSCRAYISNFSRSSELNCEINKSQFRDMQYLLGYAQNNDFDQINYSHLEKNIELIFKLNKAFYNYQEIDANLQAKNYEKLASNLTSRLICMASFYSSRNPSLACTLLRCSSSVRILVIFSKRFQTTLLKAFARMLMSKFFPVSCLS